MTEQDAVKLIMGEMLAGADGPIDPFVAWVGEAVVKANMRILYALGYKVESYLIGEDFEKQQERDKKYFTSPGDCKESVGGTRRRGSSKTSRKVRKSRT